MTATPSSRQAWRIPSFGFSMSRQKGEYSTWRAEMWWTLQARRRVFADTSLSPR